MATTTMPPSQALTPSPPPAVPPFPVWRLTVDRYEAMIRAGILTENDPVELIRGWIIPRMPKGIRHCRSTRRARKALERPLPEGWYADEEKVIDLRAVDGMPEPDVQVTRGDPDRDFGDRIPGPSDLGLVVEVADSSYDIGLTVKGPDYARAGIRVYWIINLVAGRLEVFELPPGVENSPGYPEPRIFGPDDLVPVVLDGVEVGRLPVRDLLPPTAAEA